MQPAHYAALLRVDQTPLQTAPPQCDPRYVVAGDVMTVISPSTSSKSQRVAFVARYDAAAVEMVTLAAHCAEHLNDTAATYHADLRSTSPDAPAVVR